MADMVVLSLPLRKRKNCKRRINPPTEYTDQELYDRFRFSRAALEYIVDLVRTDIGEHTTDSGKPLSCESVVCTAIRYLATDFFQRVVGDTMSVSQSCAQNCLWRFVDALSHGRDYSHSSTRESRGRAAALRRDSLLSNGYWLLGWNACSNNAA